MPIKLSDNPQTIKFLKEIYSDIAKPGCVNVGQALGTVFGFCNLLLYPFEKANIYRQEVLQKNLEKYREKLKNTRTEDIVVVPNEIAVPIIEKLSYTTDESISNLFVELLAKASKKDAASRVHPNFSNIVSSLSPDEASILKYIYNKKRINFVNLIAIDKQNQAHIAVLKEVLTGLENIINLSFPENIPAYFSNLQGLGIIGLIEKEAIGSNAYEDLITCYKNLENEFYNPDKIIKYKRGVIDLTQYGHLFLQACFE